MTDMEKLRVLLPHWIEHNHSHGAEFAKWAAIAGQAGRPAVAALIDQAIAALTDANQALTQALAAVGGPAPETAHHHR